MTPYQRTIAKAVSCRGVGVHSGRTVHLNVKPAPLNHGIQFRRVDLPDAPVIPARFQNVVDTSLATVIGDGGCIVSTIEHLMAAFAGLSIDNALVELDNYEMPIMDGSAAPFAERLLAAGLAAQRGPKCYLVVKKPVVLTEGDKKVTARPASGFALSCTISFPHPLIRTQTFELALSADNFLTQIAPARTFGFLQEVEMMKRFGLGRGGSLENAVVIGPDRVMNKTGLRFPDEFVRHKTLDCLGDFSLLGLPVLGHISTECSGHAFNHAFVRHFLAQTDCWETLTLHDITDLRTQCPLSVAG